MDKNIFPARILGIGQTTTLELVRFVVRDADGNDLLVDAVTIETENASISGREAVDTVVMRSDSLVAYAKKILEFEDETKECIDEGYADNYERIREIAESFAEQIFYAEFQSKESPATAWREYRTSLSETDMLHAIRAFGKKMAELRSTGVRRRAEQFEKIEDSERIFQEECVRNRARTFAENIFGSGAQEKENDINDWISYLRSTPASRREIAILAFHGEFTAMAERNRNEQRAARQRMAKTGEYYVTALRTVRQERAERQKLVQQQGQKTDDD